MWKLTSKSTHLRNATVDNISHVTWGFHLLYKPENRFSTSSTRDSIQKRYGCTSNIVCGNVALYRKDRLCLLLPFAIKPSVMTATGELLPYRNGLKKEKKWFSFGLKAEVLQDRTEEHSCYSVRPQRMGVVTQHLLYCLIPLYLFLSH